MTFEDKRMQPSGKLYLLPTYLSPSNTKEILAPVVIDVISHTKHYLAENARTTRRFISSLNQGIDIGDLQISTLNKDSNHSEVREMLSPLRNGLDMGLMSEAGLPCIADPGNIAVAAAHAENIEVIPMPGPSSIIQALIASGFNGQKFTFHGYLPLDKSQRKNRLKAFEKEVQLSGGTQLFMETPYRNQKLLQELLNTLSPDCQLAIAADVTGGSQFIKTKSIKQWKSNVPDIHKKPTIFSIGLKS